MQQIFKKIKKKRSAEDQDEDVVDKEIVNRQFINPSYEFKTLAFCNSNFNSDSKQQADITTETDIVEMEQMQTQNIQNINSFIMQNINAFQVFKQDNVKHHTFNDIFQIPLFLKTLLLFLEIDECLSFKNSIASLGLQFHIKKEIDLRIESAIIIGINNVLQIKYMSFYIEQFIRSQATNEFEILSTQSSQYDRDIELDIDRTLTSHDYFENPQNQDKLRSLLKALSIKYPSVGYAQGLNSIAGNLLLYLTPQQSFDLMSCLFEQYQIRYFFEKPFKKLKFVIFQVNYILEACDPTLFKCFKQFDLQILDIFITQCVFTLFSHQFDKNTLIKLWNLLLYKGEKIIVKTIISILRIQQSRILSFDDQDDIYEYFKHEITAIIPFVQLYDQIKKVKLTRSIISQIQIIFFDKINQEQQHKFEISQEQKVESMIKLNLNQNFFQQYKQLYMRKIQK